MRIRKNTIIKSVSTICFALAVFVISSASHAAVGKQVGEGADLLEQAFREGQQPIPPREAPEEAAPEEAPLEEGAPPEEAPAEEAPEEETAIPPIRTPQQQGPAAEEGQKVFVGEGEEAGAEGRTIIIDLAVTASYIYNDSPDSYTIKYHFRIEGKANANTAVFRGDAQIDAAAEGYLAKWPGGECKPSVTVPKAPFQLTFRRSDDENAKIELNFTKPILETWESKCTFGNGGRPFNTRGNPEKWLEQALQKTSPPLRNLTAALKEGEKTTSKFVINKYTVPDNPLGNFEIEGTGVVTVIPQGAAETGEPAE